MPRYNPNLLRTTQSVAVFSIGKASAVVASLLVVVALSLAVRPWATPQSGALHLHASAGKRVNAVYHAGCLAESLACTREVFDTFWKTKLKWTDADAAAIANWRQVLKAVSDNAPPQPAAPILLNSPQFHPAQSARETVLVAALEA